MTFGNMGTENREGMFEIPNHHRAAGAPLTGWDFTEQTVQGYLQDPSLNLSTEAVLGLAWRHRATTYNLWVPNWSSTSCDLGVFVYQPVEHVATSDVRLGWRRRWW